MATQVAGNDWSEILYYREKNLLELRWLPSSESMGDGGFKATLMQLAWQAEILMPASLMIDATDFAHKFGDGVMEWRNDHVIPRYSAAGVRKFAFFMPGFPNTVETGAPEVYEGPATFPTACSPNGPTRSSGSQLSGVSHKYDDVYILALRRSGLHTPLERGRAWQAEAHTPSSCLRRSGSSSKRWPPSIRHRIETSFAPRSSCTPSKALPTNRSPLGWTCHARSSPSGESGSTNNGWPVWPSDPAPDAPRSFPPRVVVEVKAIACELPATLGVPLSRLHVPDIRTAVVARGLVAQISDTTIWRWLSEDAIKPWQHRSWIFPRDPDFEQKAGVVLDLYHRTFQGRPLGPNEFVLSADEKTSIQARCRCHPTLPPAKARTMRVEHEYERGGALQYLAAWDCHHAKLFGRCEPKTGVSPFGRLVAQVMNTHPYRSAKRVFWIVDNGSSHRGQRSINRLQGQYPNLRLVHLPLHASWLNQVEIFFSILQRKVLTPNDFTELADVEHRVLAFQKRYQQTAAPFQWKFTRDDLADLMKKLHKAQVID